MSSVVNILTEAKVGDAVWLWESQRSRYVDGKYVGRGTWRIVTIDAETKKSFTVCKTRKFDRKTGGQLGLNGYSESLHIYGEEERQNRRWLSSKSQIARLVDKVRDVETLKKIAKIVEFSLPVEVEETIE